MFFKVFLLLGIQEFQVIFQITFYKASQGSKVHGLQLKRGNCFIRAPVLLACTTKAREHMESLCGFISISSLSQVCTDKPWLHKFTRKVLFPGNSPVPATKESVTIFLTSHFKARQ